MQRALRKDQSHFQIRRWKAHIFRQGADSLSEKAIELVIELGDKQCRLPRDKSLGLVKLNYRESSTVVERGSHRQNNF